MRLFFLVFFAFCSTFFASAQGTDSENWFRSDALGRSLEPLASPDPKKSDWVLNQRVAGRETTLILFHSGLEYETRKESRDSQGRLVRMISMKGGELTAEVVYRPDGRPLKEREYHEGELSWEYEYEYGPQGLSGRIVRDKDGQLLFRDALFRLPDGRLRRVERDGPSGPRGEVSWVYGSDGRFLEWQRDEDQIQKGRARALEYRGNTVRDDLIENSTVLLTRVSELTKEGLIQENEKTGVDQPQNRRVKDDRGRLILEESGDRKTAWSYDDKDRVILEVSDVGVVHEETKTVYFSQDSFERVTRLNGILLSKERWERGEKVLVDVYSRGKLVLEEIWKEGEKIKIRIFREGVQVRERDLLKAEVP